MVSCHAQLNALPFDAQKHMKVVLRIFLLLYAIVHLDLHALNYINYIKVVHYNEVDSSSVTSFIIAFMFRWTF